MLTEYKHDVTNKVQKYSGDENNTRSLSHIITQRSTVTSLITREYFAIWLLASSVLYFNKILFCFVCMIEQSVTEVFCGWRSARRACRRVVSPTRALI